MVWRVGLSTPGQSQPGLNAVYAGWLHQPLTAHDKVRYEMAQGYGLGLRAPVIVNM